MENLFKLYPTVLFPLTNIKKVIKNNIVKQLSKLMSIFVFLNLK